MRRIGNILLSPWWLFIVTLLSVSTATAEIRFDDVSDNAGISGNPSESWGAAWGELNGDIYPDLYTSNHRMPGRLLQNNGDGTFSDQSVAADKSSAFHNSTQDKHGASWADLDGDGDQDLLTTISALESPILINNDGILTNKRGSLGLTLGHNNGSRMPVAFDFNNDGRLDLKLVGVRETYTNQTVFQQQPDGAFTKLSESAGLRCLNTQWAQFIELNGTGTLEMLCGDRNGFPSDIYDYSTGTGVALPADRLQKSRDVISGDFDGNLQPDIIHVLGAQRPTDAYQVNDQRVEFQAVISGSGKRTLTIDTPGILSLGVTTDNWNFIQNDGSLDDIYIGASGYHPDSNQLVLDPADVTNHGMAFVDQINGLYIGFDPDKQQWKLVVRAKKYFSYGYFVIDSSEAITATNLSGLGAGEFPIKPLLMLNTNGNLTDASTSSGLQMEKCISGVAGDFDNDMDLDVFLACRDGAQNIANVLYENDGSGSFTKVGYTGAEGAVGAAVNDMAGTSESVVTADYDVDGFLDLFVTNGLAMRPTGEGADSQLFHNQGNGNHWTELDLQGTASNRDGIGAKVLVTAGGVTQYREQNGGYHRWSQNHMRLHVGLGSNPVIDEIKILWPSGATDVYTNVAADHLYRATEGASTLQALAGDPPTPAAPHCGTPEYRKSIEQATFLWQDCDGDGSWHLRVTGGGASTSVYFTGSIQSAGGVQGISTISVEAADVLDTLSDPDMLSYELGVWGSGQDGIDFQVAPAACFTPALPEGVPVYLGSDRVPMTMPSLDMTTGAECLPPVANTDFCGEPNIDVRTDLATFLWQDCEGDGRWRLKVTGGGTAKAVNFEGQIQSEGGVQEISPISIEQNDVLDTLSDPDTLNYTLRVWNTGRDSIAFRVGPDACFMPGTPTDTPVYIGGGRILLQNQSLDMNLGGACDADDHDSDGDGLPDSIEAGLGTNPSVADTDGGGVSDGDEFWAGSDPLDGSDDLELLDTDGDGLSDAEEALLGTNPGAADSDGGGANDGDEIAAGTDPLNANDDAAVNNFTVAFQDISVASGIAGYASESWGSAWGDYNGDNYPDLFTSNHRTPGRLFRNNGNGTFTDISVLADASKVFSQSYKDSHAASWADIDNDGDADLTMAVGTQGFYLINDNGSLRERRNELGLVTDFSGEQRMPVLFDLNNDGLLDLKMVNWNETANTNTVFTQNAELDFALTDSSVGMDCQRGDWAQFIDINGSGPLELLCGGEKDFPTAAYDYENGSGAVVDMVRTALVNDSIAADFDGDLLQDLLHVRGRRRVDQIYQADEDSVELHSLINFNGTRVFTIETKGDLQTLLTENNWNVLQKTGSFNNVFIGAGGYQPANGNLQLDASNTVNHGLAPIGKRDGLFIGYDTASGKWHLLFNSTNMFSSAYLVVNSSTAITATTAFGFADGNEPMEPTLLLNQAGNFTDNTAGSGLEAAQCISGVAGDFDNDMDQDVYLACRNGAENLANILYENRGDGTFTRVNGSFGAEGQRGANVLDNAGVAESVTTADIDLDGFLDLLVTNGLNMRPLDYGGEDQLFRNMGNANHWVQFDLVGTQSNRDAMGARLVVSAGGVSQYREQNGGYHRWSQNHKRIHFGLAGYDRVDTITVTWPSGLVETYSDIPADSLYVMTEGQGLEVAGR